MKIVLTTLMFTSLAFGATIVPFEREVPRVEKYSFLGSGSSESGNYFIEYAGDENDVEYSQGFGILNQGPNLIVPEQPYSMEMIQRSYSFVTNDGSQRENYIWVTDSNGSGRISDLFESVIVFLPRVGQMHIEENSDSLLVTLSTGEEVVFSSSHKAITGGVLSEAPVDLNPNRANRQFAGIKYSGKGIMIRSDSRAADPRLGKSLQVIKEGLKPCVLSKDSFWTQEGYPQFKFVKDEDAFQLIKDRCGAEYLP